MRVIRFIMLANSIVATTLLTIEAAIHKFLFGIGVLSLGVVAILAICQLIIKGETE